MGEICGVVQCSEEYAIVATSLIRTMRGAICLNETRLAI